MKAMRRKLVGWIMIVAAAVAVALSTIVNTGATLEQVLTFLGVVAGVLVLGVPQAYQNKILHNMGFDPMYPAKSIVLVTGLFVALWTATPGVALGASLYRCFAYGLTAGLGMETVLEGYARIQTQTHASELSGTR